MRSRAGASKTAMRSTGLLCLLTFVLQILQLVILDCACSCPVACFSILELKVARFHTLACVYCRSQAMVAFEKLITQTIPACARQLLRSFKLDAPPSSAELIASVHKAGINIRFIGLLFEHFALEQHDAVNGSAAAGNASADSSTVAAERETAVETSGKAGKRKRKKKAAGNGSGNAAAVASTEVKRSTDVQPSSSENASTAIASSASVAAADSISPLSSPRPALPPPMQFPKRNASDNSPENATASESKSAGTSAAQTSRSDSQHSAASALEDKHSGESGEAALSAEAVALRQLLLSEMIIRVVKRRLFAAWREKTGLATEVTANAFVAFCRRLAALCCCLVFMHNNGIHSCCSTSVVGSVLAVIVLRFLVSHLHLL